MYRNTFPPYEESIETSGLGRYPTSVEFMDIDSSITTYDGGYDALQAHPTPISLGWDATQWALGDFYDLVVNQKDKEPFLQLHAKYPATEATPRIVYLDKSADTSKHHHPCIFPGESCWKSKIRPAFGRSADLLRHYAHAHVNARRPEEVYCDYNNCTRAKDPFTRKDHYRDHLRDFHKEDLPQSEGKTHRAADSRRTHPGWWRCANCLRRVTVATDGWKCCGFECDPSRQKARVGDSLGVVEEAEAEYPQPSTWSSNPNTSSYTTSQSFNSQPAYLDYTSSKVREQWRNHD